ncbi:ATP-dependent protease La [Backusella circina FSU 941]|nr:ATP-dependent protease La [Backusella circina FSU 941]
MEGLPDTLVAIPLDAKVLLPSIHSKIELKGRHSTSLVRKYIQLKEKPVFIACIPILTSIADITTADQDDDALFRYGCAARVTKLYKSNHGFMLHVEGIERFKIKEFIRHHEALHVSVEYGKDELDEHSDEAIAFTALTRTFVAKLKLKKMDGMSLSAQADTLTEVMETSFDEKLTILSIMETRERIVKVTEWMTRQLHLLRISEQINESIQGKLNQNQREFYLRHQMEIIQKKLNGEQPEEAEDELEILAHQITELPDEVATVAQRELAQLKKLQPASGDYAVGLTYLQLLVDLPWKRASSDVVEMGVARAQLEQDHFGLEQVKKRIMEYVSVMKIKGGLRAPILCFVGPPGVGKTSLARSISTALGREYHRISLGGVRDEAEMRGHRRTYVGAMPGLIIQGIRKCKVNNPLLLLDEIDKLVSSSHLGNPAAALLEILDPEQNNSFSDHYLNVPFDLSNVLFIATANSLDTIPEPLLDRMEVIHLSGYTLDEKLHIAKSHLIPKQLQMHGMDSSKVQITEAALIKLAEGYTRESGVRTLERTIGSIVRAKCVEWVDPESTKTEYSTMVDVEAVEKILGMVYYEKEIAERESVPGLVTGLAYSGSGNGGILFIEATKMPGTGKLKLTGKLGEVIQESAMIAVTWVKSHAYTLKLVSDKRSSLTKNTDIHIHVPSGAVPKDGPSAGITLVCALVSLYSGSYVPPTTAMTGEMTLRGKVLPVGGIKEKVISAHRAGIQKVILPLLNRKDVEQEVPEELKKEMEFVFVDDMWEVLDAALMVNRSKKWQGRSLESSL